MFSFQCSVNRRKAIVSLFVTCVIFATAMGCGAESVSAPAAGIQQATPDATVIHVPVPAEPVPETVKLMDNAYSSYCALTARIQIEKSITQITVEASVQGNFRQLILDPRGNQWEATHVLIAPVIFTLPSGNRNKQIWAIYCADNEVIHVEHCGFGNLPAE